MSPQPYRSAGRRPRRKRRKLTRQDNGRAAKLARGAIPDAHRERRAARQELRSIGSYPLEDAELSILREGKVRR